MDCIDTKYYHTVNILDMPYVNIVKFHTYITQNGDMEGSCVALHDFYGLIYG